MTTDCSSGQPEIRSITEPGLRPGGPVLTERALEICNFPPGSRVADIGCGTGDTLECLERSGTCRSVGLDYSEMHLRETIPRLVLGRLIRGRAETLPFKKGFFDALFCECVFSLLGDRTTAFWEFERVLKDGGFLIVSDIFGRGGSGERESGAKSKEFRAKGLLAKEDLLGLLARFGFSLLLWEEHEKLLKEFAAHLILAGERLPDQWACRQDQEGKKKAQSAISCFLLVARKSSRHEFDPAAG